MKASMGNQRAAVVREIKRRGIDPADWCIGDLIEEAMGARSSFRGRVHYILSRMARVIEASGGR